MLFIKSTEMENIHRKTKHIVNYGFCCTFILLLHIFLRQGGREEGGSGRPSQVCDQAGRDKHEEGKKNKTQNQKKSRASRHHNHHSSIVRLCLSFVPPHIW